MEFEEKIKTWSGSELVYYHAKNEREQAAIEAEINRRLDKNVPKILDAVSNFFTRITANED